MPAAQPHLSPPPSTDFGSVFGRLKPHLSALDAFLHAQLDAFEPEIRDMADYCIDTSGKRIRPALVFFSGWQGDQAPPLDSLVKVAAVVELVHLATLVHDDIMDESELRRGRRTAARQFGPEAAVLLGDALFAHALHLAAQFPTTEVCLAVSDSTRKVCAGEIVQTLRRGTTNITRADYDRVIDLKTAELFRVSCALGASLAGSPPDFPPAAARYGRQLGIAYQIYDDLADFFGQENRIGKTLGTDMASGKITLPLLLLLQRLPATEHAELTAELTGNRPPEIDRWLRRMREEGIFADTFAALGTELAAGEQALTPFDSTVPATALLRELATVLRHQVASLS